MKKNKLKIALILLFIIFIALATIAGQLFNKLNGTVTLIIVSICLVCIFAIFLYWKEKSDRQDDRKIIDLDSKWKVKNKTKKNSLRVFFFVLLFFNFYIFFHSEINNYYSLIFLGIYLVLNMVFLTAKKLVVDHNAIHCFPNCKVKWTELRDYQLDKKEGILTLEKEDGQRIQVKTIKEEDYKAIESMTKKYIPVS